MIKKYQTQIYTSKINVIKINIISTKFITHFQLHDVPTVFKLET